MPTTIVNPEKVAVLTTMTFCMEVTEMFVFTIIFGVYFTDAAGDQLTNDCLAKTGVTLPIMYEPGKINLGA